MSAVRLKKVRATLAALEVHKTSKVAPVCHERRTTKGLFFGSPMVIETQRLIFNQNMKQGLGQTLELLCF